MTKPKRAAQSSSDTTNNSNPTAIPARATLSLIHVDELHAIWPADPRIPSVESRRAWALARDINPSKVHDWFNGRRRVAKKLRLKIPADTYELPVGTPPSIPIVIKDESVEPDVPLPTISEPVNTSKRKRNVKIEPSNDDSIPEPTKQPRTKKRKVDMSGSNTENDAPTAEIEPVRKAVPTNKTLKRKRNTNDDAASTVEPASTKTQLKKKKKTSDMEPPADTVAVESAAALSTKTLRPKKKTDNESPADTVKSVAPIPPKTAKKKKKQNQNDIESAAGPLTEPSPAPAKPLKKKKKVVTEPAAEPDVQPPPKKSRRKVRFTSPSNSTPPSSSPTLHASSPPASDAPTLIDEASSSPSQPLKNKTHAHPSIEPDNSNARSYTPAAEANKSIASKSSASKKKSTATRKRRKAKVTPDATPALEEPQLVCDQGRHAESTSFTCALCAASTPEETDDDAHADSPLGALDYVFSFTFPPAPAPLLPLDGLVIDMTELSALPFLADPSAFLTPPELPLAPLDSPFLLDDEGGYVLDGQRFACGGMHIDAGTAEFFPVPVPTAEGWSERMQELGLGSDGMPLEDWPREGVSVGYGEGDVDLAGSTFELRLPAYSFLFD